MFWLTINFIFVYWLLQVNHAYNQDLYMVYTCSWSVDIKLSLTSLQKVINGWLSARFKACEKDAKHEPYNENHDVGTQERSNTIAYKYLGQFNVTKFLRLLI